MGMIQAAVFPFVPATPTQRSTAKRLHRKRMRRDGVNNVLRREWEEWREAVELEAAEQQWREEMAMESLFDNFDDFEPCDHLFDKWDEDATELVEGDSAWLDEFLDFSVLI